MIMVSHDHLLIKSLCTRVIWLDHGKMMADGAPEDVVAQYLAGRKSEQHV
jgi:ABC-type polysaccharide/polyol phosphate transport system ATPase subunit